jgi:hypothetical protein
MANQENDCSVCIEQMNKSSRKRVNCGSCNYSACRDCYKRYLLDTNENPHCMSCKNNWNHLSMLERFDKSFVNTIYKSHRENVLIDRERSKMVATQPYVEQILLNNKLKVEITSMECERRNIDTKIQELQSNIKFHNPRTSEKKNFIRKCMSEDCKGFLSSQWKCGMCNHWSCPDCHVVIGMERGQEISGILHECNADTLATAKLLDLDTKTCPKCSTGIFKIDGCDMMFCIECHTSFSWKTGKIETGAIHNPHYFEWLKNGGQTIERNPNEVRCGREMDHHFIEKMLHHSKIYKNVLSAKCRDILITRCRCIIHTRHVSMATFERIEIYEDNLDLRIMFMLNNMNDDNFKKKLQQREKLKVKKQEYLNILGMFVNCQTEIFYRIDDLLAEWNNRQNFNLDLSTELGKITEESELLMEYTNDCLFNISRTYNSIQYKFNNNFELKNRVE